MSRTYPVLSELHQVRETLSQLRTFDLKVGSDGRARCMLSPFKSKTGRSQPSSSRFLFALSPWARHLLKPEYTKCCHFQSSHLQRTTRAWRVSALWVDTVGNFSNTYLFQRCSGTDASSDFVAFAETVDLEFASSSLVCEGSEWFGCFLYRTVFHYFLC